MTQWFTPEEIQQDPILKFLIPNDKLPEELYRISGNFADLAQVVLTLCPRNAERTVALRKLLEAKDAAVRAALP